MQQIIKKDIMLKINRNYLLILIYLLNVNLVSSQYLEKREEKANKKFFIGTSFGLGRINPVEINEYMYDYYRSEGFDIDKTTANIHFFVQADLNLSYFIIKNIEIIGAYSAAIAWSFVDDVDMIGMNNDRMNSIIKLSPSIGANYHYYLSKLNSIFFGGAISYNKLILNVDTENNTMKGSAPGINFNVGYLTRNTKHPICLAFEYDIAKTEAKQKNPDDYYYSSSANLPEYLSFTGLNFSVGIKF
jgi:hypothetical protein